MKNQKPRITKKGEYMKAMRIINKITLVVALALLAAGVLVVSAGCQSSSPTDTSTTRILSGTLESTTSASLTKAVTDVTNSCIGDVCTIKAMNANGDVVTGTVDSSNNRWQIELNAGEWLVGFYDAQGKLLGHLEVNGVMGFTLESGTDINIGVVRFQDGNFITLEDIEGLGANGFRSAYGRDSDFDGIVDQLDDDYMDVTYDPNVFSVIKFRPNSESPHVAACRPIKIYFSQPVDQNTISASTVIVTDGEGTVVAGTYEYEEDIEDASENGIVESEYELKFFPTGGFLPGATINVLIPTGETGILNTSGTPLDKEYTLTFTVASETNAAICHDPDDEHDQVREREREQEQEREQNGNGNQDDQGTSGETED